MTQTTAPDANTFAGGFRVGFPPTSIGKPITVTDPKPQFGLGKAVGGIAGIGAGGAGVAAGTALWRVSAAQSAVRTAGKALGLSIAIPSGAVAMMGVFAVIAGVTDLAGSLQ